MILHALALPALGIVYLTNIPLALKATAANDLAHFGVKKAIIKSLMLFAGYEIIFIYGALKALRRRPAV
jgi:hypothetical protein